MNFITRSEEYEPDAKPIQTATSMDGPEATSLSKLSSEQYGNLVSFVRCDLILHSSSPLSLECCCVHSLSKLPCKH